MTDDDQYLVEFRNPPAPLGKLTWIGLSVLPEYFQELISAMYFAVCTQEPFRYERVALAYHGFNLFQDYELGTGYRVRSAELQESRDIYVAKRVTDGFRTEVDILQLLGSKELASHRNHTATASHVLWGRRIHLTPLYHQFIDVDITPNDVLRIAKQLVEGVAFMHEHRIAHMDISSRNFLMASNFEHPELRLLLMDVEFAVRFPQGVEPIINIWNEAHKPPEGRYGVNAFAYDVYWSGNALEGILKGYNIKVMCKGAPWPPLFLKLIERMMDPSPKRRPTAAEADAVMQSIDENQPLPHS
ncbi:hypothetical protein FS837_000986, partial [Tulasnella sp. UAMH 9824]